MLSNAGNNEVDEDESNLINFNDSKDPHRKKVIAFNTNQEEHLNPAVDKEFNELANSFQDEDFKYNDVKEIESDMGMYVWMK